MGSRRDMPHGMKCPVGDFGSKMLSPKNVYNSWVENPFDPSIISVYTQNSKGRAEMAEKKNRLRPTQLHFYVNDREFELIKAKMKQIGTDNLSGYLR